MNNSRRNFLRNSSLATLAFTLPFQKELLAMANNKRKFGIQLWTVKEALIKDPVGVLTYLSKCGFQQIESYEGPNGFFWGMKNTEFKKLMDDLGMTIVSTHCDTTTNFERKAAEAAEIGMKYIICPHKGAQPSLDNYKKFAEEFNHCGEIANKHGIRFAYHNHDYSFKPMNGQLPQDIMMQGTDKKLVDFEMDIYWVVAAGMDPIAYMKKYADRFKLCHVKDYSVIPGGHESCILGKGSIDFKKVLHEAAGLGMQYYIVEQEAYTGTTELDAAKADASYMKSITW
jgi:sugar phosphate isomerase/epimerase